MKDFVLIENFHNIPTNEVFIEMGESYKNRIKTQRYFQKECSFFHQFKDEEVNTEVRLNGKYLVEVVFTPDDNWFTIDSIEVKDSILTYPYDFESTHRNDSVYKDAETYITDNNLYMEMV